MRVLNYLPRRRVPRPVWSARTVSLFAIFLLVAAVLPVLIFGERSLLARADIIAAIVAGATWTTLVVGLYHGARVRRDEAMPAYTGTGLSSHSNNLDLLPDGLDGVDDLFGVVFAIVLWLAVALLLVLFLPLLLEGVAFVLFLLLTAVMWIIHRALRQVFIRGPRCRGRLGPAVRYASLYTLAYTGWLFGVLLAIRGLQ